MSNYNKLTKDELIEKIKNDKELHASKMHEKDVKIDELRNARWEMERKLKNMGDINPEEHGKRIENLKDTTSQLEKANEQIEILTKENQAYKKQLERTIQGLQNHDVMVENILQILGGVHNMAGTLKNNLVNQFNKGDE